VGFAMILFSKPNCDKCNDIKKLLKDSNVQFLEKNIKDAGVLDELKPLLAGMKNALLPVLQFDDGSVVSNDMGLYRELKARGVLAK
jgi:glutaredoxin